MYFSLSLSLSLSLSHTHTHTHIEGMVVGKLNLADCGMNVICLKDIATDPEASVESLLKVLSEHIDTLADASHYFVIDPTDTTVQSANIRDVSFNGSVYIECIQLTIDYRHWFSSSMFLTVSQEGYCVL